MKCMEEGAYAKLRGRPPGASDAKSRFNGEPGWDRTNDPLIKSQMLYR
jgi:hypothetical protein